MVHVVVVGGGLAGLTATLQASQLAQDLKVDLSITVVEKCGRPGGNSMRASSGINALTPSNDDTCELYAKDTLASGGGLSNPELVSTLVVSQCFSRVLWDRVTPSGRLAAVSHSPTSDISHSSTLAMCPPTLQLGCSCQHTP
jgi:aspartate oxidase